jgi:hypothetical protein
MQAPPGKQRENPRQIEILYLRQLLFRQALSSEFSHHRLPHFLPR